MKELRILCFGASLVEGFTQSGMKYTPYSTSMVRKLKEEFPAAELQADVDGKSGQMVVLHFKNRMKKRFAGG
jgi:hypothetical protein